MFSADNLSEYCNMVALETFAITLASDIPVHHRSCQLHFRYKPCRLARTTAVQHVSFVNLSLFDKTSSTWRALRSTTRDEGGCMQNKQLLNVGAQAVVRQVPKENVIFAETPDLIRSHFLCYPIKWPQES